MESVLRHGAGQDVVASLLVSRLRSRMRTIWSAPFHAAVRQWPRMVAATLLLGLPPAPSASAQVAEHRVVILSHDTNDVRLPMTLEAVKFWNDTARELGLGVTVAEEVIVGSPVERALENYARSISHRAGRLRPGPSEPDAPTEITNFGASVVVLLSRQDLMSFAWPLPRRPGHFVAIEEDRHAMARNPNIARNIIAHELGHTLGLSHNDDPASLMCGPCRTTELAIDRPVYMRLTPGDRQRLVERYPAN